MKRCEVAGCQATSHNSRVFRFKRVEKQKLPRHSRYLEWLAGERSIFPWLRSFVRSRSAGEELKSAKERQDKGRRRARENVLFALAILGSSLLKRAAPTEGIACHSLTHRHANTTGGSVWVHRFFVYRRLITTFLPLLPFSLPSSPSSSSSSFPFSFPFSFSCSYTGCSKGSCQTSEARCSTYSAKKVLINVVYQKQSY